MADPHPKFCLCRPNGLELKKLELTGNEREKLIVTEPTLSQDPPKANVVAFLEWDATKWRAMAIESTNRQETDFWFLLSNLLIRFQETAYF